MEQLSGGLRRWLHVGFFHPAVCPDSHERVHKSDFAGTSPLSHHFPVIMRLVIHSGLMVNLHGRFLFLTPCCGKIVITVCVQGSVLSDA